METNSAFALTIASVIGLLPQAVIGLFEGVWIDRFNGKKIMIIADNTVALSSLFLGVLFFIGIQPISPRSVMTDRLPSGEDGVWG